MLLNFFEIFLVIFWKLSLNVVENVTKVEILFIFLFKPNAKFFTLIHYSTNMCWTSYEHTVLNKLTPNTEQPTITGVKSDSARQRGSDVEDLISLTYHVATLG